MHRVEVDVGGVADGAEGFEARHGAILVARRCRPPTLVRRDARAPVTVPCPWTAATSTPSPIRSPCCATSTASSGCPTQPIPGSVDAVARLRAGGRRVVFVTNNSSALVATQEDGAGGDRDPGRPATW